MFLIDQLLLLGGVLLLIGILSSKFSLRLGLPVLVLFLLVGMVAGEDGIGRIDFDNFAVAHAIGTLALAIILFDGGLRTHVSSLQAAWKPAALLATVGVLITSVVTGLAAAKILGLPMLHGLLLGSIVASTDAAAVFSVLRSQGLRLRREIAAVLEVESGSNDPMAIFLTIGIIDVLQGRLTLGPDLLQLLLVQMGIGSIAGILIGWLAVHLVNRINLPAPGLYPVLTGACGLLAYGAAAWSGGSGFLAIYLAGIVFGNHRTVFQRGTFFFLDGLAWIGQIVMFVMLGLLSTPSALLPIVADGLLIAAVLILVARPLAVVAILLPFGFRPREHVFISWVGLKGAVPIILATFPPLLGVEHGILLFNVVFFVVLVSAALQGWTLPVLAHRLGLQEERSTEPPVSLEITALQHVNAEIVDYTVGTGSRAAGRRINELALPPGVVIAMIARGTDLIPPGGGTEIASGDHVFVVLRPESKGAVDHAFGSDAAV